MSKLKTQKTENKKNEDKLKIEINNEQENSFSAIEKADENNNLIRTSSELTIGDRKQKVLKDQSTLEKKENYILTPVFNFKSRKLGYKADVLGKIPSPEKKLEHPISEYKVYTDLSLKEKTIISYFCVYKIGKHICSKPTVGEKIKSFFISQNLPYFDTKSIFPVVLDLINYLGENNDSLGIFRVYSSPTIYRAISNRLDAGLEFNFKKFKETDLACALKSFLRDDINGVFPKSIVASLYFAFNSGDINTLIKISKYLPFSMSPKKRDLFVAIMQMFEKIASNKKKNKMTVKNLIISSAPSFFPHIEYEDFYVCHYQALILETFIQEVQMNYIHNSIYDEAMEFGKTLEIEGEGKVFKKPTLTSCMN